MKFDLEYYIMRSKMIDNLWTGNNVEEYLIKYSKILIEDRKRKKRVLDNEEVLYEVIDKYFGERWGITTKSPEIWDKIEEMKISEPEFLKKIDNETKALMKLEEHNYKKFFKTTIKPFKRKNRDFEYSGNISMDCFRRNAYHMYEINKNFEIDDKKFEELQFFILRYNLDINFGKITKYTNFRNFHMDIMMTRRKMLKVSDIYKDELDFLKRYDGFSLKENNESEFKTNSEKWDYMFKVAEILTKLIKDGIIEKPKNYLNLLHTLIEEKSLSTLF